MADSDWFIQEQGMFSHTWQKLVVSLMSFYGSSPNHVAFVMDGNRRYARAKKMGHVVEGHEHGFRQMARVLNWCRLFGIHEVSVYAFSIENFKREKSEVDGLMKLAAEKFRNLLEQSEKLKEMQIRFSFSGHRELLSTELQDLMKNIEVMTKDYKEWRVNVCMPYTSRDELARSFEKIRIGVEKGEIDENDIDEQLIEKNMDGEDGHVDLLVRTSGEKRLSDFFLWQSSNCHLYFTNVLWPEFCFNDLAQAIASFIFRRSKVMSVQH